MSTKSSEELSAQHAAAPAQNTPKVGLVVGCDPERGLLVEVPGSGRGPQPVRSTIALDARAIDAAVRERRSALLLFEDGDPEKPIMIGLMETVAATPLLDLLLPPAEEGEPAPAPQAAMPSALGDGARSAPSLEAKVDGKRVVLEAEEEIELRCGEASITLRRNGRVVIRGAYVETHARGVNRIKGGSVAIN